MRGGYEIQPKRGGRMIEYNVFFDQIDRVRITVKANSAEEAEEKAIEEYEEDYYATPNCVVEEE